MHTVSSSQAYRPRVQLLSTWIMFMPSRYNDVGGKGERNPLMEVAKRLVEKHFTIVMSSPPYHFQTGETKKLVNEIFPTNPRNKR